MKDTYLLVGLLVLYAGISFGAISDDEGSGWDWGGDDASGSGDYPYALTDCQERAIQAQQELRLNDRYSGYVPQCDSKGNYEAMQCNNSPSRHECWCVNSDGFEIQGTRKDLSSTSRVTCVGFDGSKNVEPVIVTEKSEVEEGGNNGLGFEDDSDETGENGDTSHNGSDDIFKEENTQPTTEFLKQPLILASGIALVVVFLLCAVLLVMFIVYRMRKKDEGSYSLDEPKRAPSHPYQRAPTKEYFA